MQSLNTLLWWGCENAWRSETVILAQAPMIILCALDFVTKCSEGYGKGFNNEFLFEQIYSPPPQHGLTCSYKQQSFLLFIISREADKKFPLLKNESNTKWCIPTFFVLYLFYIVLYKSIYSFLAIKSLLGTKEITPGNLYLLFKKVIQHYATESPHPNPHKWISNTKWCTPTYCVINLFHIVLYKSMYFISSY